VLPSEEAEAALGGSIGIGTAFLGSFVYDDSATVRDGYPETDLPGQPGFSAAWALYFPTISTHGEIGDFVRDSVSGGGEIELRDNEQFLDGALPSGVFVAGGFASPPVPRGALSLMELQLIASGGDPGSPLHGTFLEQPIPWTSDSFPTATATFVFHDGGSPVSGERTEIRVRGVVTFVPEPARLGLVALAACAGLAFRRSRT
jgi:hypothetical protein